MSIWQSFAKARESFKKINKSQDGYNYKYAGLEEILAAVEPALAEQKLMLTHQILSNDKGSFLCTSVVCSETGEKVPVTTELPLNTKLDPQKLGSAITYFRRYSILCMLNLCPVESDDDGERASQDRLRQGAANNHSDDSWLGDFAAAAPESSSKSNSGPYLGSGTHQAAKSAPGASEGSGQEMFF